MELPFRELVPHLGTGCGAFIPDQDPTTTGRELHDAIWKSGTTGTAELYEGGLAYLARLRAEVDVIERELVTDARAQRFTWEQIGRWLGTSRQGAYNRSPASAAAIARPGTTGGFDLDPFRNLSHLSLWTRSDSGATCCRVAVAVLPGDPVPS